MYVEPPGGGGGGGGGGMGVLVVGGGAGVCVVGTWWVVDGGCGGVDCGCGVDVGVCVVPETSVGDTEVVPWRTEVVISGEV